MPLKYTTKTQGHQSTAAEITANRPLAEKDQDDSAGPQK